MSLNVRALTTWFGRVLRARVFWRWARTLVLITAMAVLASRLSGDYTVGVAVIVVNWVFMTIGYIDGLDDGIEAAKRVYFQRD